LYIYEPQGIKGLNEEDWVRLDMQCTWAL